ncbi:MAG TPA: hypothetical protein VFU47_08010 [Armatimonadota bacterium]|nr:hypothetical protein [Armatimonadota bacterium]
MAARPCRDLSTAEPVDVLPVADADHEHQQRTVADLVDDAIPAFADAVPIVFVGPRPRSPT